MNTRRATNERTPVSTAQLFWYSLTWVFAGLIVVSIIAFIALCFVPYYANGINRQSPANVFGSAYDPINLPPYKWVFLKGVGYVLLLGAGWAWFGVQFAVPVLAISVMTISTLQRRNMPSSANWALWVISVIGCIFTILASTVFFPILHWLAGSP